MITDFYDLPNLVSCQYLDRDLAVKIDEFLGRLIANDQKLLKAHQASKEIASDELAAYEDWLCAQERIDPASWLLDDDVPW